LTDRQLARESKPQEDAEFKEELDGKSLKELMQLQRRLREEAERKASVLNATKGGDISALRPYMKNPHDVAVINTEDDEKGVAIVAEKHLRNEISVDYVKGAESPAQALEDKKQWLKETFPTQQSDAILVKDIDGNYLVESLGISIQEMNAAKDVQKDKRDFEEKAGQVTTYIQEKIHKGPQRDAGPASDGSATALSTPSVQRQSITEFGPPRRT
jgi:hypothetical protein